MNKQAKALSVETLAQVFLQLARMESAGLPPVQALGLLDQRDKSLQPRLRAMQRLAQDGCAIAEAGFKAGIFDPNHRALIQAAENGGTLAAVYQQLGDYYQVLDQRIKRIRSRLVLPVMVLIVAMLAQPLPALVSGDMSGGQYAVRAFAIVSVLALAGFVVKNLTCWLEQAGLQSVWDGLMLKWPLLGQWLTVRQLNTFFVMLAMMLEAGLAFSEALPRAVATIRNRALRAQFDMALASSHSGASVVSTLRLVRAIKPSTLQIMASGEQSGKLAGSLRHFTRIEAETLALQDDALAAWVPRLLYGLIAGILAYSMLSGGAVFPR